MTNPFPMLNLNGYGTQRGVTLALPTERVRDLLPAGLELGPQDVTPEGTHPVILFFHDMFRLHTSFPSLLPSLTYREHSVNIPFCYISQGTPGPASPGPYQFMPRLYLDSVLATLGGLLYWGFPKRLARVTVTDDRYTVYRQGDDQAITAMTWKATGEHRPIEEYEHFDAIRKTISQPFVSMMPAGLGPFFILSDFDKQWDVATIRPFETVTDVFEAYVPGYDPGRYPGRGRSPGIDTSVLGSYELRSPWRLTLPYPPVLFGS